MATRSKQTFIRVASTAPYDHQEVKDIIREARAQLDPEYPICVNVKMKRKGSYYGVTGWAYSQVPEVSNAPKTARRLITLKLPQPHGQWPLRNRSYAGKEDSTRDWPRYDLHSWQEALFKTAAHEFAHCRQYDEDRPLSEMDAERRAKAALLRWRSGGSPGAGYDYLDLITMAQCSPDSPSVYHPRDLLGQSKWLSDRLARTTGLKLSPDQVEVISESWWTEMRSHSNATRTIRLDVF